MQESISRNDIRETSRKYFSILIQIMDHNNALLITGSKEITGNTGNPIQVSKEIGVQRKLNMMQANLAEKKWATLFTGNKMAAKDSFEMLTDSFIKAHVGAKKVQARKADIFKVAQGESELLQEFVTRFHKERMLLVAVPDEWTVEAFTKGLNARSSDAFRKLKESLLEFQQQLAKGREKSREKSKYNYDADRQTSRGRFLPYEQTEGRGRNFRTANKFTVDRGTNHGRNNRSLLDKETLGSQDPSYPKLSEYNFNVNIVELVSVMRNIKECEYHGTNDHRTWDCRHLREEVATLLKNGHLREFLSDRAKNNYGLNRDNEASSKAGEEPPRQMINMIFRGNEINRVTFLAVKNTKVSITHSKRLREYDITFTEEDTDGLLLPHNDALIRGDQLAAREMNAIPVSSSKGKEHTT
ncbi:uncharacterized protein [Nicotiana tomentosiformis]|uniref:uncharacterized protein n=1 Tax=Nicotiana tomentosiformis TaxID=4098 RepID=UPI00388C547C